VITLRADDGTERKATYDLPTDAKLEIETGSLIGAGQPIAKLDIEAAKTKDITGGLPRVAELFEARAKEKSAVLSKVDGRIDEIVGDTLKRLVRVKTDDGVTEEHLVKGQQVIVRVGDMVRAGEALSDGPLSPHEILSVRGERDVAEYLVNEIQQVYRLQGVRINDKHIEVIVRQMLRRVRIKEVGDSSFLPDEQVEKWVLDEENKRLAADPTKRPAIAEPLLLGITKASLATDSFISASSFQETTKVLTAAALKGKVDYLHGLKENVIMGRLIPAGTGLKAYRSLTHEVSPKDLGDAQGDLD
jgi:DNA-directed RNA polymerase subunit beta'